MGWQGFVITLSIALGGTAAAALTVWLWPRRIPEGRSVAEIRQKVQRSDRRVQIEQENALMDTDVWPVGFPHDAPDHRMSQLEAQMTMQRHRTCLVNECPRKTAAWRVLVDAGRITPDSGRRPLEP
ncbi:hypothetical protein APR12_004966 [Nocardia amikacinitolerans]|uniref:hypothetical protein n=1 Tax=Nocardia amikacinitolerans TaxID=756689 RepID=UPI00082F8BAA|nr:hypothetical protein [Nocardia amikacinitolerans]MCP2319597.1 hypothetical protein [Nocardia amikacinitolerans]